MINNHKGAAYHRSAALHHELAAQHHRQAANHYDVKDYAQAAHQGQIAAGHLHHAMHHVSEAAKYHAEHYGDEAVKYGTQHYELGSSAHKETTP